MTRRRRMMGFAARLVAAGLVIGCTSAEGRAATLTDVLTAEPLTRGTFRPLADALAQQVGRSLPVVAASPGIRFEYDYGSNAYLRQDTVAGELFVERADPIGRGHWNFSAVYQHLRFDRFGDRDLHDLTDPHPIVNGARDLLLSVDREDIDVDIEEASFNVIYGASDRLDVSAAVPLIASSVDVRERLTVFNPQRQVSGHFAASNTGIGDVTLRSKLSLLKAEWLHASSGLSLRIPTGSSDDLQGLGSPEVTPSLFASSSRRTIGHGCTVGGHANLSMVFNTDDVSRGEGRWAVAGDLGFGPRGTIGVGLIGRHAVSGLLPERLPEFPRCLSSVPLCKAGKGFYARRPLFGFSGGRPDYLDLSIGGRLVAWRDVVIVFADVLLPLLDEGLIADPIPVVGVEISL